MPAIKVLSSGAELRCGGPRPGLGAGEGGLLDKEGSVGWWAGTRHSKQKQCGTLGSPVSIRHRLPIAGGLPAEGGLAPTFLVLEEGSRSRC